LIRIVEITAKGVLVDKNASTGRIIGVAVGEEITCFYSIPMAGSTIRQPILQHIGISTVLGGEGLHAISSQHRI
jgi:hypothetical protein